MILSLSLPSYSLSLPLLPSLNLRLPPSLSFPLPPSASHTLPPSASHSPLYLPLPPSPLCPNNIPGKKPPSSAIPAPDAELHYSPAPRCSAETLGPGDSRCKSMSSSTCRFSFVIKVCHRPSVVFMSLQMSVIIKLVLMLFIKSVCVD